MHVRSKADETLVIVEKSFANARILSEVQCACKNDDEASRKNLILKSTVNQMDSKSL